MRHEEKTGILRGLIIKVRNELKGGWPEAVYHQALAYTLEDEGIPFVSKLRRPFLHRCVEIHLFEPDFIVWNTGEMERP